MKIEKPDEFKDAIISARECLMDVFLSVSVDMKDSDYLKFLEAQKLVAELARKYAE